MAGRFAKLKQDWFLRGWTDAPLTAANWVRGDVRLLDKKGFYIAESCDGNTNFDSLAFLPEHQALLEVFIKEGIAETCREGDAVEPCQRYRKANNPRLAGIHWCVTGFCNLKCRHCYMESPSGRYGELPFQDMVRLIEQFEQANVLEVSLTGGEPFMRKDILDIVTLLAKKKIWLSQIYSNGLLITEEHLQEINNLGFSPSFQISFDGVGAHDQMRGTQGIEQTVIKTIQRLRASCFPVVVATSIDKTNITRLADTYELMKELDVQLWRIASPQESGNWRGNTTALSLDEEANVYKPLLKQWLNDGKPLNINLAGFFRGTQARKELGEILKSSEGDSGLIMPEEGEDSSNYTPDSYDCGMCREQPNLLPDGTLIPCPGYADSNLQRLMPNLLHEDLSSVWNKSYLREIVDIKKKDLFIKNPECAGCQLFKKCGIGCRALALTKTGDLMAKDMVSCDLWKKGYKKLFKELAIGANNQ
jgi:Predicted Fe-S oxidoreductases